jgi:hypothetical protein
MDILKDRRVLLAGGAGLALAAGLVLALTLSVRGGKPTDAPPASQGGLVVQTGRDDDIKLDAKRPLRCFVNGQFVGEVPLGECAKKNGVATGALDVGLDPSGALAASSGVSADITPLPPQPVTTLAEPAPVVTPVAAMGAPPVVQTAPSGACWRYGAGEWKQLPTEMPLNACIQSLYAGHCERAAGAAYGRWTDQTLRQTAGRVEISSDNRNFRTLFEQAPGCPPTG